MLIPVSGYFIIFDTVLCCAAVSIIIISIVKPHDENSESVLYIKVL